PKKRAVTAPQLTPQAPPPRTAPAAPPRRGLGLRPAQDDTEVAVSDDTPHAEHFDLGERALARNRFSTARGRFEAALEQDPDNGNYRAHLAWATLLCHPDRVEQARKDLEKAAQSKDGAEVASYFLGTLALRDDDFNQAIKHLRRT